MVIFVGYIHYLLATPFYLSCACGDLFELLPLRIHLLTNYLLSGIAFYGIILIKTDKIHHQKTGRLKQKTISLTPLNQTSK